MTLPPGLPAIVVPIDAGVPIPLPAILLPAIPFAVARGVRLRARADAETMRGFRIDPLPAVRQKPA